jgi:hypothetical protein
VLQGCHQPPGNFSRAHPATCARFRSEAAQNSYDRSHLSFRGYFMLGNITVSAFSAYDADWIGCAGDNMVWQHKASSSRTDVVDQRLKFECR